MKSQMILPGAVSKSKLIIVSIIALAFLVRACNLDSPIIGKHDWRQADTASMARNFHENGYHFLYPQIDWGGNSPGYVESGFPIYPYTVALLYGLLGVHEYLGRLLSVIFFIFTIWYLFLIIRKHANEEVALWSCFFYAFLPLNIYYSRTFQPESALLFCSAAGTYFFSQWLDSEKTRYFVFSSLLIMTACLIKVYVLYLGLPLLYLAWSVKGRKTIMDWRFWLYGAIIFSGVGLWYHHAYQIRLIHGYSFNIWEYGTDKWGNWTQLLSPEYWKVVFHDYLYIKHFAIVGLFIFIFGLFQKPRLKSENLFLYWLLANLIFLIIVADGNKIHEYYQLPVMLPAVYFMGKAYAVHFKKENKRFVRAVLFLCIIVILQTSIRINMKYFRMENPELSERFQLAQSIMDVTEPGSLIISVYYYGNPNIFYLSHRKGWRTTWEYIEPSYIEDKKRQGADYMVGNFNSMSKRINDPEVQQEIRSLIRNAGNIVFEKHQMFIVDLKN